MPSSGKNSAEICCPCSRFEGLIVALPIEEIRICNRSLIELRRLPVDRGQPVGIGERQWIEQDAIYNGKKRGIRPDAQGERQNRDQREPWVLSQHPHGVFHVLHECSHACTSPADTSFHRRKFHLVLLFVAQGDHGIYVCGFARRQPPRQQRHRHEQSRRDRENDGIACLHTKKQRFDHSADSVCSDEP
jgi:hypothetical protein